MIGVDKKLESLIEKAVDYESIKNLPDKDVELLLKKRKDLREKIQKLQEKEKKKAIQTVLENSYLLDKYDAETIRKLQEETGFEFWVIEDLHFFFDGAKAEDLKGKVLLIPKVNAKVSFSVNVKEIIKNAKPVGQVSLDSYAST